MKVANKKYFKNDYLLLGKGPADIFLTIKTRLNVSENSSAVPQALCMFHPKSLIQLGNAAYLFENKAALS